VQKFLGRGGFAYVYLAEDAQGRKVALKLGDVAARRRYVTRFSRSPTCAPGMISPTRLREAVFSAHGVRIDFLDMHEIDSLVRSEPSLGDVKHPNVVRVRDQFADRRAARWW